MNETKQQQLTYYEELHKKIQQDSESLERLINDIKKTNRQKHSDPSLSSEAVNRYLIEMLTKVSTENGILRNEVEYLKSELENRNPAYSLKYGYIYAMQRPDSGMIKIGLSKQPEKRLLEIKKDTSERVRILKLWPVSNMIEAEKILHNYFKKYRVRGEWFDINTWNLSMVSALIQGYIAGSVNSEEINSINSEAGESNE